MVEENIRARTRARTHSRKARLISTVLAHDRDVLAVMSMPLWVDISGAFGYRVNRGRFSVPFL